MTPNNAPNGLPQQTNGQRRSNRVAIPLPLSRPRPAKAQPRQEKKVAEEAPAVQSSDSEAGTEEKALDAPVIDESSKDATEAATSKDTSEVVESAANEGSQPVSRGNEIEPFVNDEPSEKSQQASEASSPSPDAASALPNNSTQTTARKPANIRTELPPAFVPSAGQHTPRSASSSLQINRNSQAFQPQPHLSRPSTSSIVFGGEDSGTSSPAPPHSAGSGFMPPPTSAQRMQQPPPPFVPANHAHHYSEPQAYHPQQQQWNYQRQYNPTPHQPPGFHSHAHVNFRYPPREPFVPAETLQLNGHASRSASPGSATTNDAQRFAQDLRSPVTGDRGSEGARFAAQEPRAAYSGHQGYRPQPRSIQHQATDFRSESENGQQLREHVLAHYADPSLADCHLQITLEEDGSRQYIDGHKLILARSPTLLDLIRKAGEVATASAKTQVEISLQGKYVTLKTFSDCLRYIYGGPILLFGTNARHTINSPDGMPSNGELMEEALQYVATSAWLRLHAPAVRGVEVAVSLLHWDTLAAALGFALEGGLSPNWTMDDGSTDRSSTASSDDSLESVSNPTFDPYSTELLKHILHFTVTTFPPNFYIDTSAAQLQSSPRLPSAPPTHEKNKPSTSAHPRLGELRFGDHPVNKPTQMTTSISSLLFSLPFPLLKFLLEHPILAERLGGDTVASIIRQVVNERESRREKAVKARAVAPAAGNEAVNAQVLANLNWIESTETTVHGRVGLRLVRRRKGVDTPASSGAEDVEA